MSLSDIFGGSSSVKLGTPGQRQLTQDIADFVRPQLGSGVEAYGGPLVAGVTPNMASVFDSASSVLDGSRFGPEVDAAISELLGSGGPQASADYYKKTVLDPANLAFKDALREVGGRYGDVWGGSGALKEMMERSTARYGTGIADTLAQLSFADRQAGLNRLGTGIGLANQTSQLDATNLSQLLGIGGVERGIEQEGLSADYSNWLSQQGYNNPYLGLIQPALGAQMTGVGQQAGILPGVIGAAKGATSVASGLSGLFG